MRPRLFFLLLISAALFCRHGVAGTFTNLYSFTNGADGAYPQAGLAVSGGALFGTAMSGGTNGNGTIFSIGANGGNFKLLHTFNAASTGPALSPTNGDGINPQDGLILSGATLYGTAAFGGTNGSGTVFALATNGSGFTTLYDFSQRINLGAGIYSNSDGAYPYAGLALAGNTLYGAANVAGTNGRGALFSVSAGGANFARLHSFGPQAFDSAIHVYTNSDGEFPQANLILSGRMLYGATPAGGPSGNGVVFAMNTNGTGFAVLHPFGVMAGDGVTGAQTNSDGAQPQQGLVLDGDRLYGTAKYGGTNGAGVIFAVNTNGTGFTVLHTFSPLVYDDAPGYNTNRDGGNPVAGLILFKQTLFGTTTAGGTNGGGTIFYVSTNGGNLTVLHHFINGENPQGGLVLSDYTLYGMTTDGGGGYGTVYAQALSGPIPLNVQFNGSTVTLSWSNPQFVLQTAASATGSWISLPGAASPYPYPVLNSMQFFRLVNTNGF